MPGHTRHGGQGTCFSLSLGMPLAPHRISRGEDTLADANAPPTPLFKFSPAQYWAN